MRMQICISYANFIELLALISDQSRLARPSLTKGFIDRKTLFWQVLPQPISPRF